MSEYKPRKQVPCREADTTEAQGANFAKLATSPELSAYRVLDVVERQSGIGENLDVPTLLEQLKEQASLANSGDLSRAEAMLMNQAVALQGLFTALVEKALTAKYINQFDSYMRTGLKAQSQCRASLETLSALKNPPIVYAKQANVTTGPQQINNTIGSHEETKSTPNKIQEKTDGKWMDFRTKASNERIGSAVETMVEDDRTKDCRGESQGQSKRI